MCPSLKRLGLAEDVQGLEVGGRGLGVAAKSAEGRALAVESHSFAQTVFQPPRQGHGLAVTLHGDLALPGQVVRPTELDPSRHELALLLFGGQEVHGLLQKVEGFLVSSDEGIEAAEVLERRSF